VAPEINFTAKKYHEVITWNASTITEPPLTRSLTIAEIEHKIRTASFPDDGITSFPCHTQAVERMVRVVTEAAAEVCGMENRESSIRAKVASRKKMARFATKRDFVF